MIVTDLKHGRAVIERLSRFPWCSLDTEGVINPRFGETNGYTKKDTLIFGRSDTNIFSACYKGESYSFVTSILGVDYPTMYQWGKLLKPLFENDDIIKVFHNARYDVNVFFTNFDIDCHLHNIWDTMIGCWASNANRNKSLKERAPFYGRNILKTATISFTDLDDLSEYAEEDSIAHDEFFQMQKFGFVDRPKYIRYLKADGKFLKKKNPMPSGKIVVDGEACDEATRLLLETQEFPILRAAIRAERRGFPLQRDTLKKVQSKVTTSLEECEERIQKHFGYYVKLSSNPQIVKAFQSLDIPLVEKTNSGAPSVSITALVAVRHVHPVVEELIKYRGLEKLNSSYTSDKGLIAYINPETDRVHASISTVGAVTGRSSCSLPNMQQIPSRKDTFGIKSCFGFTRSNITPESSLRKLLEKKSKPKKSMKKMKKTKTSLLRRIKR